MICHKNFEKCLLFKRQITVKFQKKLLLVGNFFSWKTLYLVLVHVIIQQIKCILFLNVMRFYLLEKKYLDPRFWEGPILFKFMFTLILVLYKLNFVYFYLRFVNRIALLEYFNFFFRIFRIYTVPLTLYQQMWTYWCTLMVRVKKIEGSNFIILYDHSYRIA